MSFVVRFVYTKNIQFAAKFAKLRSKIKLFFWVWEKGTITTPPILLRSFHLILVKVWVLAIALLT